MFLTDSHSRKKFERGATDVFKFSNMNVGPMSKIIIGHDGSGIAAGWKLVEVIVENTAIRELKTFVANRWVAFLCRGSHYDPCVPQFNVSPGLFCVIRLS